MAEGEDSQLGIPSTNTSPELTSSPDCCQKAHSDDNNGTKSPRVKRAYKKREASPKTFSQLPTLKIPKLNYTSSMLEEVGTDRAVRRRPRRLRIKDIEVDVPNVNVMRMTASRHISTKGRSSCTHSYRQLAGFNVRGPRPQKNDNTPTSPVTGEQLDADDTVEQKYELEGAESPPVADPEPRQKIRKPKRAYRRRQKIVVQDPPPVVEDPLSVEDDLLSVVNDPPSVVSDLPPVVSGPLSVNGPAEEAVETTDQPRDLHEEVGDDSRSIVSDRTEPIDLECKDEIESTEDVDDQVAMAQSDDGNGSESESVDNGRASPELYDNNTDTLLDDGGDRLNNNKRSERILNRTCQLRPAKYSTSGKRLGRPRTVNKDYPDDLVIKEAHARLLRKELVANGVLVTVRKTKTKTSDVDVPDNKRRRKKKRAKKSTGSADNSSERNDDYHNNIIAAIETVVALTPAHVDVKPTAVKASTSQPQEESQSQTKQSTGEEGPAQPSPPPATCKILPRHSKLMPPKLVYKDLLKVAPVKHLPDRLAKRKWTHHHNNSSSNHSDVNNFNTVGCFKSITMRRFNTYTQICMPTDTASRGTLTISVLKELVTAIHSAQQEGSRCLLLSGSGSYFCSGIDLQFIISDKTKCNALKMAEGVRDFIQCLINFPKPVIAAVNGPAIGLGAAILPLCDIVYASDKSWFYTPYGRLGQTPEGCSSYTFPKLGTLFANDMLFGNRKMTANEACQKGLVSQVFWPDNFMREVTERVRTMASCPAKSLQACKALIKYGLKDELLEVNERESTLLYERWTASDCQNAIKLYLDKLIKET